MRLWALLACTSTFLFMACPSESKPTLDAAPNTPTADVVADVAADAPAGDAVADTAGPQGYPNISEVFGFPFTTGASPEPNPAWLAACEAELPLNATPSLPAAPARAENCAGDPTQCGGDPANPQDCAAEPAVTKWLHRVTLDTTAHPNAVCNDGSPGLIEVRKGVDAGTNTWLIWFKGGSACRDQHRCARRWCGNQSGTTYDAGIMSSDWNGDGIVDRPHCLRGEAGSALDADLPGNPFADANVVKVWYCGSDTHMGRALVQHEDLDPDSDGTPRHFSMETRGRHIVEAVLATLDAGVTSDDGAVTMPSLTTAERVVISGSSAGSMGAMQNLDAMAEHITGNAPSAVVRGVLDANVPPSDEVYASYGVYIDAAFDAMSTPGVPFEQWRRDSTLKGWTEGWQKAADVHVDQSCLAHIQSTEGDDGMDKCLHAAELLLTKDASDTPVLTTPVFVRFDLGDAVAGAAYKDCADFITGQPCYAPNHSLLSYESASPSAWLDLFDSSDHNRATMIQLLTSGTSVGGVFSPACGTHTGFTNNNFTQQIAEDYDNGAFSGMPMNFMQALGQWLETGQTVRVIDASKSEPDAPSAQCSGSQG